MDKEKAAKNFIKFLGIIEKLRGPDGCPWDKEQTHESLLPYFLEETYEVIESIEEKAQKDSKIYKNIDIEIRGRRDYIIVNLFDTGTGFKNKKTKDLIKPYFTTKEKGTGLGLSIVDKIISDHKGSINFLNKKSGAKIQIIIPNK